MSTQPETLVATIFCSPCRRPTKHRFSFARTLPGAKHDQHWFACGECRASRIYGTASHAEPEAA
jgi:hypothetical protein